ncbi:MAG: hypothetical protein EPO09_12440 [Aquabacterium sp.]|uniref:hypothetical protein n=1 Tax=Aquabacterium sp. TaxID=1872578 RepID=UPI00120AE9E4|nr:hypothetical protein [Aquabacterium sp.]TAK93506.1 MAG: hypothetical protein EPO09_12440 [Aquabacterium sp.]
MTESDQKENLEKIDRIRSRMFCNQLKKVFLGDAHDCRDAQAKALIVHPASPVTSEATFLSWWHGSRKIQKNKLELADLAVPTISRWFELEHIGSPMQRHMGALRTLSLEVGNGDWVQRKRKRIDEGVAAAQSIWATIWALDQLHTDGCLSMAWQLEQLGAVLGQPSLRYADDVSRVRVESGLINGYAFEVTAGARASYASQNESGLFRFLLSLVFEPDVNEQPWWPLLTLDIGAAAAHCRARMSVDLRDPYTVFGASDLNWVFIISRALWCDEHTFIGSLPSSSKSVSAEVSISRFVKQMQELRKTYQSLVNEHGVNHDEISSVARPETDYVEEAKNRRR